MKSDNVSTMRELRTKERKAVSNRMGGKEGSPLLRWIGSGGNKRGQVGRTGAEQEVKENKVKEEVEGQEIGEEEATKDKHTEVKKESGEEDHELKEEDHELKEEDEESQDEMGKKGREGDDAERGIVISVKKGDGSQNQEDAGTDVDTGTNQEGNAKDTDVPSPPSSSDDFNDYERRRQENILKNKLLLQQLQLDTALLGSKKKSRAPLKPATRKKKGPSVSVEHVPRRQSSRLAGLPAEPGAAKRTYEEEAAAYAEAERVKRRRVPEDATFDVAGIDFTLKGDRYVRTFTDEDVRGSENQDVRELREELMSLELYERWAPNQLKITPERIYCIGFHPIAKKQIIFAGDKLGTLGVWDASSSKPDPDAEEEDYETGLPSLTEFKVHPRTISSFTFSPFSPNTILTSSYDSSIRSFDLLKGLSTELYAAGGDEGISGVEIHKDNPFIIYFATLEGHFGRKDTRLPRVADVWPLSEKKIGGFSMHPQHTHLCVTASLDRTVKIWDLRKIERCGITGAEDERHEKRPTLIGEHAYQKSISSAYWNRNGSIVATSYDDTVKIYRFPGAGLWNPGAKILAKECGGVGDGQVKPGSVIKHNNQTGRWVTILKAQWQQSPRDGVEKLVIGNMNRFIDIYAEDGTQLAQLGHSDITTVPAAVHFHPTENWVVGGTASGKVVFFQ